MWKTVTNITTSRFYYPAALILILLFTGMRLVHINADAPQDLSISAASYTDEGFKTYQPRNKTLFGDWKWTPEDEYTGWLKQSPLTVLQYDLVFTHFNTSYASIRGLSVFYAAITMIVLFIFLLKNYDRETALVGLVLYGTNFFTAMFNRLGLYETHLLCFIMISIYGFSEFLRPYRARRGEEDPGTYSAKKLISRSLFFLLGFGAFAAGFFIKRNLLIILPALIPAALVYVCCRYNKSEKFTNRIFMAFVSVFAFVYLIFAHMGELKVKLAFLLLSFNVFGQPLISFIPFTAFDPLHQVLAKGMYMEFIFLHPFTFFAAFLYSLYTFYRYISGKSRSQLDLFASSWFIFGFIFTTVLYYSPSRYYLLLVIPLVITAGRLIARIGSIDASGFIAEKKKFPHNMMFGMLLLFSVLYTGVVFLVQAVPASYRNSIIDTLYPAYIKGDMSQAIVIIAIVLALELTFIAITILNRRRLLGLVKHPKFGAILLSLILALQMFQYGRWFIFHDHNLYAASRDLGRALPHNAVIAGSWSAGLVVENGLKALILQSLIPYNHNVVNKILHDIPIQVNSLTGGEKTVRLQKNIPVYLAVCRNVIFEKAIVEIYKDHLLPENRIAQYRFGLFRIEVFKMKKFQHKESDVVNSLFKSFL